MILALFGLAHADPIALRAPGAAPGADADTKSADAPPAEAPGLGLAAVASGPDLSVGAWLPGGALGVAVEADASGGPVGAAVAWRRSWRGPKGFGFDVVGAGGVAVPVAAPAAVVTLTPSAAMGWRTARIDATLGLVAPVAVRVAPAPAVSVPVRLEPWLGVHVGPATIGAGAGLGYVWTSDELWAVDVRWMLAVAVRP